MKIKFDKYLKNKRDHLDVEDPDEMMLWEGIRKELISEKKTSGFNIWKVAAILLAFFTLSYIVYNEVSRDREIEFTLSQIHKSLGEKEKKYQNRVIEKMQSADIKELQGHHEGDIFPVLFNELVELDTIYQEAMQDLKQHGYMERTVNIIFDTYEKRIHILEQIIMESQKIERYENDQHEIVL